MINVATIQDFMYQSSFYSNMTHFKYVLAGEQYLQYNKKVVQS